jgi:hypothetical protein
MGFQRVFLVLRTSKPVGLRGIALENICLLKGFYFKLFYLHIKGK